MTEDLKGQLDERAPRGPELCTILLLSELVGYFNAVATCQSERQAAEEDFAIRCSALRENLLLAGSVT
jgi:hypothetical protein